MKSIRVLFLLLLAVYKLSELDAQSLPGYWGNLKAGKYTVGFKSKVVFDSTRTYDLTCGDTTSFLKNRNAARPVLINMWYPAAKSNTPFLKIKDFFDFPVNESATCFLNQLKELQYKGSKTYTVDQNLRKSDLSIEGDTTPAGRENKRKLVFENYIHSNTISHRNAKPIEDEFPVIIYHQGLGGTIDENYLLLEYLASHGYIVINSAFQVTDGSGREGGWYTGVGEYEASFADFTFLINYCKRNNISKSKKVYLAGHSFGANSAVTYIGEGRQHVDGLIPLDSDYGYVLNNFFPKKFNPFVKEKIRFYNQMPMFCAGRAEAHYRMLDSLTQSKRYFLTIPEMTHNDFTALGGIGRYFCLPYVREKEKYKRIYTNYLNMCSAILKFMDGYTKNGKEPGKNEFRLYPNWKLEISKPGEKSPLNSPFDPSKNNCPSISQFIDIVTIQGLNEIDKVCASCSDSTTKSAMALDVFDLMYEDSLKVISYLQWLDKIGLVEKNLYQIYFSVFSLSFLDSGKGYHFNKAVPIYKWMIDRYSDNKYGYLGMAVYALTTGEGKAVDYCRKVIEADPDYLKTKTVSFWDGYIKEKIRKCLE